MSKSRHFSPHRLLIGGLILGIVIAAARILAVQGWIRPVRVVSGSMVERLLGEHFVVKCADCGFLFRFGAESPPPNERAVCPNCGYTRNPTRQAVPGRGDRVIIDRAAYLIDSPKRFDLVAFRDLRQPSRKVVKRVLGLPGERIGIRHGELYVNGKLLQKSLTDFHRVAQFVHDNDFVPHPKQFLPERWRSDEAVSGWQRNGNHGFQYVAPTPTPSDTNSSVPKIDWLSYHHWRCFANSYPRSSEAPIADNCGYNQGESRELREVTDIVLSCQVTLGQGRELYLRVHDGHDWFLLHLDGSQQAVTLRRDEQTLATARISADVPLDKLELEFGLVDQQIVIGINGRELLRHRYEPSSDSMQPLPNPIAIGGGQSELQVSRLLLRRDVYYLDPWLVGQRWEAAEPAGKGEYLVLGDNPAISDDSRMWKHPYLTTKDLLGRVTPFPR